MAMTIQRYKGDLISKQIAISDDLNVSYLENSTKSDKTLVLIHGFGVSKENWLLLADELDDKYHLIIPDLIGHGDSSKPMDIDYSIANQAKLLRKFLVKFKEKNIVLVGNSMGGAVALEYAYRYNAKSLILLNSLGLQVERSYVDKLGAKKAKELYLNVCSIEKMKEIIDLAYVKPPYIPDILLEELTKIKCQNSKLEEYKYSFILDEELNVKDNLTDKAKAIKIPTLIIWGREDKLISIKNAEAFHKYIKNSKLVVFDNIGHMPMLEDAKLTASSIEKFVSISKE